MQVVPRYDNGSEHMEWASTPCSTMSLAWRIVEHGWQAPSQDVIAVNVTDKDKWTEGEVVAKVAECGYCGNSELREFSKIDIHGELLTVDAHSCGYCGGV